MHKYAHKQVPLFFKMMNYRILLIVIFGISNILALNVEELKKNMPMSELRKIKLCSSLNEGLLEDPKKELERLEELSKAVKWFNKIEELKELTTETLKAIEDEKLEIEAFKGIIFELQEKEKENEKGLVDKYVKSLSETIEGFLPNLGYIEKNQIVTIKKWILACKYVRNGICKSSDVEGLKNDQKSAISILRKDENGELLMKLSSKSKVQVWFKNLNISRLVSRLRTVQNSMKTSANEFKFKSKNVLIQKASISMNLVLNEMTRALDKMVKDSVVEDNEVEGIKEEITMRSRFMNQFLKPDIKGIMSISWLSLKKDAYIKLIDNFMKKVEIQKDLKDSDLLIFKQWLFFNQMILGADWVTRSGKFVKPWPEGFSIGEYKIQKVETKTGYFFGLPKLEVKEEEILTGEGKQQQQQQQKQQQSKTASMTSRLKSIFGLGKKSDEEEKSREADKDRGSGDSEANGTFWRALDKGTSLVKGSVTKMYNNITRKSFKGEAVVGTTEGTPLVKSGESKGFLSGLFSSKKDQTSSTSASADNQQQQQQQQEQQENVEAPAVSTAKPSREPEKKGYFSSILPSWSTSKTATAPTPPVEEKPKKSSWFSW
jgi:hypothetical protein